MVYVLKRHVSVLDEIKGTLNGSGENEPCPNTDDWNGMTTREIGALNE